MDRHGLDEDALRSIGEEVLGLLAQEDGLSVQTSADGLVSVVMNARFELGSLTLDNVELGLEEKARLEQALTTAINDAIRMVAHHHEEQFRSLIDHGV